MGEDSYPLYRRRSPEDGGQTYAKYVQGQQTRYDNRWVVPYNAYLMLCYNAHINVEYCTSVKALECLYKYVFKGHDRAVVATAASVSLVSFRGMTDYRIMIADAFSDMACAYSQNKTSRSTARSTYLFPLLDRLISTYTSQYWASLSAGISRVAIYFHVTANNNNFICCLH